MEDIPGISAKESYEFYLDMLSKSRIEVFFNGDGDAQEVSLLFGKVFDTIKNRNPIALCETFVTGKAKEKVLERCEEMPVSQGKLAIGFRTGVVINDKECAALALANEIFGGSPVSKLFMNVREKMSLCYYCKSVPDAYKGVMFVLSGIESENRDKSLNAIMKELQDMKDGNISEEEIQAAKLSLLNGYKTIDDNPSGLCSWYLARIICDNFENPEAVAQRIKNISKEEIVSAVNKVQLDTVYFLKGTGEDA